MILYLVFRPDAGRQPFIIPTIPSENQPSSHEGVEKVLRSYSQDAVSPCPTNISEVNTVLTTTKVADCLRVVHVCSPLGRRYRFFPAEIKQSYHKVEHSQADDPNDWMFISDLGYDHVIDGLLATWDTDGLLEGAMSFACWLWTIQATSGHLTRCRS